MVRFLVTLAAALSGILVQAQETALSATKPDTLGSTAASTAPSFPIVQMLVITGVLFVLFKYAAPKLLKSAKSRVTTPLGSEIKIEESASFAQGNLYVVSVRGRTLLLSGSQAGVSCLADLTADPDAAPEPKAFFEQLNEAMEAPIPVEDPKSRLDALVGRVL